MIESLAARIGAKLGSFSYPARVPEISTAASLAHHGLQLSVRGMRLRDVDLASVPAEHLASLAACVTGDVGICNVSNTDLTSILDKSKSRVLDIYNQSLSIEETRALVRAMANVEWVWLGYNGEVTVDMSTLVTYNGRGNCRRVDFCYGTAEKYREVVRGWAQGMSWRVTGDDSHLIIIHRKELVILVICIYRKDFFIISPIVVLCYRYNTPRCDSSPKRISRQNIILLPQILTRNSVFLENISCL